MSDDLSAQMAKTGRFQQTRPIHGRLLASALAQGRAFTANPDEPPPPLLGSLDFSTIERPAIEADDTGAKAASAGSEASAAVASSNAVAPEPLKPRDGWWVSELHGCYECKAGGASVRIFPKDDGFTVSVNEAWLDGQWPTFKRAEAAAKRAAGA